MTTPQIIDKNLKIKTKVLKKLFIKGSDKYLRKAILSIWENAIIYTPKYKNIKLITNKYQQNIMIEITDSGPGISKKEQEKIWQRFYRGQSGMHSGSGSGLGLAIAKKIIEEHQGSIKLESSLKKGSTFTISLPIYQN